MKYALGSAALIGLGILASTALPARADLGAVDPTSSGATSATPAALALCSASTPCSPAFGNSSPIWSVASGGCGLRNRGDCSVDISGAKSPAQAAMVFWSIILPSGRNTADPTVSTVFVAHGELGATVKGELIGTGPDPCWLTNSTSTPIAAYLGFLPLSIVNSESNPTPGNGLYHVFLQPGGSGLTSGASPWGQPFNTVAPLAEGVSIVIFGTGNQKVAIWGGPGFTGATFAGGTQAYALKFAPFLPNANAVGTANFVSMYADGQVGITDYGYSAAASKAMIINGVNVAGIGSTINPTSGLNGDSGAPLPRLWDNTEMDIGGMGVFAANQAQMNITVGGAGNGDCITPIAHVLTY